MHWRDVNDELPDDEGYVLAYRHVNTTDAIFMYWFAPTAGFDPCLKIAHWMPLPPPPEERPNG